MRIISNAITQTKAENNIDSPFIYLSNTADGTFTNYTRDNDYMPNGIIYIGMKDFYASEVKGYVHTKALAGVLRQVFHEPRHAVQYTRQPYDMTFKQYQQMTTDDILARQYRGLYWSLYPDMLHEIDAEHTALPDLNNHIDEYSDILAGSDIKKYVVEHINNMQLSPHSEWFGRTTISSLEEGTEILKQRFEALCIPKNCKPFNIQQLNHPNAETDFGMRIFGDLKTMKALESADNLGAQKKILTKFMAKNNPDYYKLVKSGIPLEYRMFEQSPEQTFLTDHERRNPKMPELRTSDSGPDYEY